MLDKVVDEMGKIDDYISCPHKVVTREAGASICMACGRELPFADDEKSD